MTRGSRRLVAALVGAPAGLKWVLVVVGVVLGGGSSSTIGECCWIFASSNGCDWPTQLPAGTVEPNEHITELNPNDGDAIRRV